MQMITTRKITINKPYQVRDFQTWAPAVRLPRSRTPSDACVIGLIEFITGTCRTCMEKSRYSAFGWGITGNPMEEIP